MTYTVQMWLTSTASSPEEHQVFAKRWTSALQSAWSAITCSSSNPGDLAYELNARIKADCKQQIADDVAGGNLASVVGVDAFTGDGWITGDGVHSGRHAVLAMLALSSGGTPWTVAVNGGSISISVCASFSGAAS